MVVLTPVVDARRLTGVLALARVDADVAPLPGRGCLVAAPADAPEAQDAEDEDPLARTVSRALGATVVLALRSDVTSTGSGSVRVERWERGERVHGADVERSPGLVLAGLPDDAERVVHGSVRVADLPDATSSAGLGRLEAARLAAGREHGARPDLPAPRARPSSLVPAVLAGTGLLVLLLELVQLLAGGGSPLVAAVGLLAVVVGTSTALRRRAAAREADVDDEPPAH